MPYEGRFMFFGEAVAWAARFGGLNETRAAAALPSIGGRVAASEGGYIQGAPPISFDSASSEVVGGTDGPHYMTRATTQITGFNVAGVVSIPTLRVSLASIHDTDQQNDPAIHLDVDPFTVYLNGVATPVTLWSGCNNYFTWAAPMGPFAPLLTASGVPVSATPSSLTAGISAIPANKKVPVAAGRQPAATPAGVVAYRSKFENATLWALESPKGSCLSSTPATNAHLYFGELAVSEGRRRFTTLRIAFTDPNGSPSGELVVGELSVNGSFHP